MIEELYKLSYTCHMGHKKFRAATWIDVPSPSVEVLSQTGVVLGPHCVTAVTKVSHRVHPVLVLVVKETTAEVDIDNSVIVYLNLEFKNKRN